MKYLIVSGEELEKYNLTNFEPKLLAEDDIDSVSSIKLPWVTPTGIVPRATRSYYIPESNRYYALLGYTGVGSIVES